MSQSFCLCHIVSKCITLLWIHAALLRSAWSVLLELRMEDTVVREVCYGASWAKLPLFMEIIHYIFKFQEQSSVAVKQKSESSKTVLFRELVTVKTHFLSTWCVLHIWLLYCFWQKKNHEESFSPFFTIKRFDYLLCSYKNILESLNVVKYIKVKIEKRNYKEKKSHFEEFRQHLKIS